MGNRTGSGYIDSGDLLVTTGLNTQIIPTEPKSHPYNSCHCIKFMFINNEPCHFIINGQTRCYRNTLEGFQSNETDAEIWSFVIEEVGIHYKYSGTY